MLLSFYLASQYLSNVGFAGLYISNALITAAFTIYYERDKNR